MGGDDTTTDTDEMVVIMTRDDGYRRYGRGPRYGPSGILVVSEPDYDNDNSESELENDVADLEDKIEETQDYLDNQFETMYYVIAILIILIIVVGYYLYLREGALAM